MSIYIVTHKKYNFPGMKNYIPIQVGAAYHEDLGFCKDSEGDNISLKNPHYNFLNLIPSEHRPHPV